MLRPALYATQAENGEQRRQYAQAHHPPGGAGAGLRVRAVPCGLEGGGHFPRGEELPSPHHQHDAEDHVERDVHHGERLVHESTASPDLLILRLLRPALSMCTNRLVANNRLVAERCRSIYSRRHLVRHLISRPLNLVRPTCSVNTERCVN
eukprot:COSAG04_NODE_1893_length_5290_cov_1.894433_3_plen_151_part_00